jgi:DNA-binding CsgD family transcriptional regulator
MNPAGRRRCILRAGATTRTNPTMTSDDGPQGSDDPQRATQGGPAGAARNDAAGAAGTGDARDDAGEATDAAIAAVYSAATGAGTWSDALGHIERALAARAAWILEVATATGELLDGRYSRPEARAAQQAYARANRTPSPLLGPLEGLAQRVWLRDDEAFDLDFLEAHPFYLQVLAALGATHASIAKLRDGPSHQTVLLAALDGPRPAGGTSRGPQAGRIALHLQRALELERGRAGASGDLRALLEHFARPMLLVDDARTLHYANGGARALLEDGAMLRAPDGRLAILPRAADRQLDDALARLAPQRSDARAGRPSPWVFSPLFVDAHGDTVGLYARRLRRRADSPDDGADPILLMLHDPRSGRATSARSVSETFGFTPAEARLCAGLVRGETLAAIAAEHGVSLNTVRTQIRSAMRRAGVARQLDLVRMLLTMPDLEL